MNPPAPFLGEVLHQLHLASLCLPNPIPRPKFIDLGVGLLCGQGPKTLTSALEWLEQDQQDWSADYRLFSQTQWLVEDLFAPLFAQAVADPTVASAPRVYTGTDDTLLRKTGKKIPGTTYARDPLSPPFQVNLVLGQRFVQTSLLIQPAGSEHPWRALPVSFSPAPTPKIPKRGSEEQQTAVKEFRKKHRLSVIALEQLHVCRRQLDLQPGGAQKWLIDAYLARWEVEVNFRDEKTLLGVGQAQVRSPQSVARAPAFLVACYALLLWSNIRVFGDHRTDSFKKLPRWRNAEPVRPSTRDLLRLLQQQAQDYQPRQAPIIPN